MHQILGARILFQRSQFQNLFMIDLDFAVLAAVDKLNPNGYGVPIQREASVILGRDISHGSIYVSLDHLEEQRFIVLRSDDLENLSLRAKRFAEITPSGKAALSAENHRRSAPHSLSHQPRYDPT